MIEFKKIKFLFIAIAMICFMVGFFNSGVEMVFAQSEGLGDLGVSQVGEQTGLSATDPRIIVGRIINAFLGILGVIFLGLILYAGFLYMTSGGEQEKVAKAKKYIISAIVGLVIILSAYAITSFIISRLTDATTGGSIVGGDDGDGGCIGSFCLSGQKNFVATSISPAGKQKIYNVKVRIVFNRPVLESTADADTIKIQKVITLEAETEEDCLAVNGNWTSGFCLAGQADCSAEWSSADARCYEAVDGTLTFENDARKIVFEPTKVCEENEEDRCFDKDSLYRVSLLAGALKSTETDTTGNNLSLTCPVGAKCAQDFATGNIYDNSAPRVSFVPPGLTNYDSVCRNSQADVILRARDNIGVSNIALYHNETLIGLEGSGEEETPEQMEASFVWTIDEDVATGSAELMAQAEDLDGNEGERSIRVKVWPEDCCTGEEMLCGVPGCPNCGGDACLDDAECEFECFIPEGETVGFCVDWPTIQDIAPSAAAPGSLITVAGRDFGEFNEQISKIYFTESYDESGNPVFVEADFGCNANLSWRDYATVAQVPDTAINGPIKIEGEFGYDDTLNDRGWQGNFILDEDLFAPGLCSVFEEECFTSCGDDQDCLKKCMKGEALDDTVRLQGIYFGEDKDVQDNIFFAQMSSLIGAGGDWDNETITGAQVPAMDGQMVNVVVQKGEICRTPLNCSTETVCQTSEGEECEQGTEDCSCKEGQVCDQGELGCFCQGGDLCDPETEEDCYCRNLYSNPVGFRVQTIQTVPTIDEISPSPAPAGQLITIQGSAFGNNVGTVEFVGGQGTLQGELTCGEGSWTNSRILINIPDKVASETFQVKVINSAGVESDPVALNINNELPAPGICSINPDNGPEQTIFGLTGFNFGEYGVYDASPWEIVFAGQSGTDDDQAVESFNANYSWQEESIAGARVPAGAQTGAVYLQQKLCQISEGQNLYCPQENICCQPSGQCLSVPQGMSKEDDADVICAGADQLPFKRSNGILFSVGSCGEDEDCGDGRVCCGNGVCRALDPASGQTKEEVCFDRAMSYESEFAWALSTGPLPIVPRVVERYCIPELNITQSVSPRKNEINACPNGIISATFNTLMDEASFNNNVIVKKCNTTVTDDEIQENRQPPCDLDECGAGCEIVFSGVIDSNSNDVTENNAVDCRYEDGTSCSERQHGQGGCECEVLEQATAIFLNETWNDLSAESWYQVELLSDRFDEAGNLIPGIQSQGNEDGVASQPLTSDYKWRFRTKADDCSPTSLLITPARGLIDTPEGEQAYTVMGLAECEMISMADKDWNWTVARHEDKLEFKSFFSADRKDIGIFGLLSYSETAPNDPAIIQAGATIDGIDVSQRAKLDINFVDPRVVGYFPDCREACINAAVGANFNTQMDGDTLISDNVKLFSCQSVDCNVLDEVVINDYNSYDGGSPLSSKLLISPAENLLPNKFYRVVITEEARSFGGDKLTGLNYVHGSGNNGDCADGLDNNFDNQIDLTGGYGEAEPNNEGYKALDYVCGCYDTEAGAFASYGAEPGTLNCQDPETFRCYNFAFGAEYADDTYIFECINEKLCYLLADADNFNVDDPSTYQSFFDISDISDFADKVYYSDNGICGVAEDYEAGAQGRFNAFSWIFKTRNDDTECRINRLEILPDDYVTQEYDEKIAYSALPYSEPDECRASGQALNPFDEDYTWGWSITDEDDILKDFTAVTVEQENPDWCTDNCLNKGSLPPGAVCGNGEIEDGEECDDDDLDNGDGCSDICLKEPFANCEDLKNGVNCCGNGIKEDYDEDGVEDEECDFGCVWLDSNGDECQPSADNAKCVCRGLNSACTGQCLNAGTTEGYKCGNGVLEPGEDADVLTSEGNRVAWLDSKCLNKGAVYKVDAVGEAPSICGNGEIEAGEECEAICVKYSEDENCGPEQSDCQVRTDASGALAWHRVEKCNPDGDETCLDDEYQCAIENNPYCSDKCLWQGFPSCDGTDGACCGNGFKEDYDWDGEEDEECEYVNCVKQVACKPIDEGCEDGLRVMPCDDPVNEDGCVCELPEYCTDTCLNKGSSGLYGSVCGDRDLDQGEDEGCESGGVPFGEGWVSPYQTFEIKSLADIIWSELDWNAVTRFSEKSDQINLEVTESLEPNEVNEVDTNTPVTLRSEQCFIDNVGINENATKPNQGDENVCRNSLVKVTFDKAVNKESITQDNIGLYRQLAEGEQCLADYLPRPFIAWKFDEQAGAVQARDLYIDEGGNEMGNNLTGKIVSATQEPGKSGNALKFTGKGFVSLQNFNFAPEAMTVSMLIKLDDEKINNIQNLFVLQNSANEYPRMLVSVYGSTVGNNSLNFVFAYESSASDSFSIERAKPSIDFDTWHNAVLSLDLTDEAEPVKFYLNGEKIRRLGSENFQIPYADYDTLSVGADVRDGQILDIGTFNYMKPYNGLIDEFMIYNQKLSEKEILTLYSRYDDQVSWLGDLWQKTVAFVKKLLFKIGLAADENEWCEVSTRLNLSENELGQSVLRIVPLEALQGKKVHLVELNDIENLCADEEHRVNLSRQFTTGADICKINEIKVDPSDNFVIDRNHEEAYSAVAYARNGDELISIANVYDWQWHWDTNDTTIVTNIGEDEDSGSGFGGRGLAEITTGDKDGIALVFANAVITADNASIGGEQTGSTVGKRHEGSGQVEVMICDNPWFEYNSADGEWDGAIAQDYRYTPGGDNKNKFIMRDITTNQGEEQPTYLREMEYNIGLFYCRDFGDNLIETCYDRETICNSEIHNNGSAPADNSPCDGIGDGLCRPVYVCQDGVTLCDPSTDYDLYNKPKEDSPCLGIGNEMCAPYGLHDDLPKLALKSASFYELEGGTRSGIYFDKNFDYVKIPDLANFDMGSQGWSLDAWVLNVNTPEDRYARLFYKNFPGGNVQIALRKAGNSNEAIVVVGMKRGDEEKVFHSDGHRLGKIPFGFNRIKVTYYPEGFEGDPNYLFEVTINSRSFRMNPLVTNLYDWSGDNAYYIGGMGQTNIPNTSLNGYVDELILRKHVSGTNTYRQFFKVNFDNNYNVSGISEPAVTHCTAEDSNSSCDNIRGTENNTPVGDFEFVDLGTLAEALGLSEEATATSGQDRANQCNDGEDNDFNGLIDLDDPKCKEIGDPWEEPALLAQYFFTRDDEYSRASARQNDEALDAVSLRVYENPEFLPPEVWYSRYAPNVSGSPSSFEADCLEDRYGRYCYQGIQDGTSTYIAATNLYSDGEVNNVYNNIYLLGYSQDGNSATGNIVSQLVQFMKFNLNLSDGDNEIIKKDKLIRNTQRVSDMVMLRYYLDLYKKSHNDEVPLLQGGTYSRGDTFSIWPSWQNELGSALGTLLPLDPYNHLQWNSPGLDGPDSAYAGELCGQDQDGQTLRCSVGNQCVVPGHECVACSRPFDKSTCYDAGFYNRDETEREDKPFAPIYNHPEENYVYYYTSNVTDSYRLGYRLSAKFEPPTDEIEEEVDYQVFPNLDNVLSEAIVYDSTPAFENGLPICMNGVDDDNDGQIDYPKDPGCSNSYDNTEGDNFINLSEPTLFAFFLDLSGSMGPGNSDKFNNDLNNFQKTFIEEIAEKADEIIDNNNTFFSVYGGTSDPIKDSPVNNAYYTKPTKFFDDATEVKELLDSLYSLPDNRWYRGGGPMPKWINEYFFQVAEEINDYQNIIYIIVTDAADNPNDDDGEGWEYQNSDMEKVALQLEAGKKARVNLIFINKSGTNPYQNFYQAYTTDYSDNEDFHGIYQQGSADTLEELMPQLVNAILGNVIEGY